MERFPPVQQEAAESRADIQKQIFCSFWKSSTKWKKIIIKKIIPSNKIRTIYASPPCSPCYNTHLSYSVLVLVSVSFPWTFSFITLFSCVLFRFLSSHCLFVFMVIDYIAHVVETNNGLLKFVNKAQKAEFQMSK